MTTYYIPTSTCPRYPLKKNGMEQKNAEYAQVEGVPCQFVKHADDMIYLHSFVSDPDTVFRVPVAEFNDQFVQTHVAEGLIYCPKYPGGKIHESEFDKRKEASILVAQATKLLIDCEPLKDKLDQLMQSQGSSKAATLPEYFGYRDGSKKLKSIENLGDAVFNRSKRWQPPVDMEHDEFKLTKGFPAPLGIRPKDFCLPSELIHTVKEMLVQMAQFKNTNENFVKFIKKIPGIVVEDKVHCCKYCGEEVDAAACTSSYKSATNYIEICHRDPNAGFSSGNMYWGHGDCNRRQGGYTEEQRIEDAVRLAMIHPEHMSLLRKLLG